MGLEICTIGGYEEVGKNMTAVKIDDDVVIFDAGIYLPALVEREEPDAKISLSGPQLRKIGALPDDKILDTIGWTKKVRSIIVGHAHLDHVGAVPYIAPKYSSAEILGTSFTIEVLMSILDDEHIHLRNLIRKIKADTSYTIKGKSNNYLVEFIRTTHSTIQCVFVALHTPYGTVFYALDFKFDDHPVMGEPPNYKKLKELAKRGIEVLIVDSLYSGAERRTPSERIARNLVEEAINNARTKEGAIFITTFSSHIARLKSIVEFGKKTNREIIFIGRSLSRYVQCAINSHECPFIKSVRVLKYRRQVDSFLKKLSNNRSKYLIVCTGHQAEPGSILDRIVSNSTPFRFQSGDHLIFSSSVIPTPKNILSRENMDKRLKLLGVRLQTDVHVSGHGGREDLRDLVEILKPKNIIPAHGSLKQEMPMVELSTELGYKSGKNVFLSANGRVIKF